jgi:hypothetical protein
LRVEARNLAINTLSASHSQSDTSKTAFVAASAVNGKKHIMSSDHLQIQPSASKRSKSNPSG